MSSSLPAVPSPRPIDKRLVWMALAGLIAATWTVIRPWGLAFPFWPHCVFHDLTHLWCPGCGGTRMLRALWAGDVAAALHNNALAFVAAGALVLETATRLWYSVSHNTLPGATSFETTWLRLRAHTWTDARVWAMLVIGFMVLRNVPWGPGLLLAPL